MDRADRRRLIRAALREQVKAGHHLGSEPQMHFIVASMNKANDAIKKYGATHLISINDRGSRTFQSRLDGSRHLTVHFEDTEKYDEFDAPTLSAVQQILHFARSIPEDSTVVVNCHAGMCRSTAVALGLAAQRYGLEALEDSATKMVDQRPIACPNRLVAHLFDLALETNGELLAIAERISNKYMLESHLIQWDQGYVLPPKDAVIKTEDDEHA